jgi:tripartite-type tricarboxylate transporter receptor subunit TctC
MKQVVETEAWQQYLDENYLVEDVRWGEDFEEYLGQLQSEFEKELTDLGAL